MLAETVTEFPKRNAKLPEGNFKQAEFKRNVFRVELPYGLPFEDMLRPEYWAHVSRLLNREGGDIIEVFAADKSIYAELLVLAASKIDAKVVVLRLIHLDDLERASVDTSEFKVQWRGPDGRFAVIRLSDKQVVSPKGGFSDKAEAEFFLEQHVKKLTS
jgi:hypothetical protein